MKDKIYACAAVIALGLIVSAALFVVNGGETSRNDSRNEATHIVDKPYAPLFRSTEALADVVTAMGSTPGGVEEKYRTRVRIVDELIRENRAIRIEKGQEVEVTKETGDGPPSATVLDLRFNGQHYISLETYFRPLY
jgi:hypothetical protein